MNGLDENEEELTQLSGGVQMLIYGMVGWLSVVTVAAIFIFIGIYVRMSRMARSLDDAETGSSVSSKSSRSSSSFIIDRVAGEITRLVASCVCVCPFVVSTLLFELFDL